jgi:hypothetical protein
VLASVLATLPENANNEVQQTVISGFLENSLWQLADAKPTYSAYSAFSADRLQRDGTHHGSC